MSATSPDRGASGPTSLFAFTTTRPVAITMMVLAAVVFGAVGLGRLPVNLLPDISYPTVTIRTQYPGTSPEDVEERVSERIQETVSVVPGVRRVVSISRPEVSDVIMEFAWGTEMVFAISDIRERLDRVFLPREAEDPLVLRYDPSLDPILTIGVSGPRSLVELHKIAEDEIERELVQVEGVAAVKIRGGDEEEILITIDEAALDVLGIDVALIGQRLAAENVNTASGSIEEGNTEFLVRALGEFHNLDEIANVIIERRNDAPIRLSDVATVTRVPKDKEVISRVNGRPTVLVDVYKEAGANVVQLADRVRSRLFGTAEQQRYVSAMDRPSRGDDGTVRDAPAPDDAAAETEEERLERLKAKAKKRRMTNFIAFKLVPLDLELSTLLDQSGFIETAIDDVRQAAILGGLFAVFVIFLFLRRFSTTVILAVSIPISLVASFAPMFLSDVSLNIMSLGGLALGVGMLVDNSIVVLESITRAREEGLSVRAAAVTGVSRVATAVTASTLTTVAVFFPIVFVEGVAGQLFRDQSLTVVYSLLMSLLVALFVIPMLASRGKQAEAEIRATTAPGSRFGRFTQDRAVTLTRWWLAPFVLGGRAFQFVFRPIAAMFDHGYRWLENLYPPLLRRALRARWAVVGIAVVLMGLAGLRARALGNELLPEVSQGEIWVELFLPRDATVERTDAVVAPIERQIAELPDVSRTFLAVGVDKDELNSSEEGEHSAKILVTLRDDGDLALTEEAVRTDVRAILDRRPELQEYRFSRPSLLQFSAALVVEILGDDLLALRQVSRDVEEALRGVAGLRDVRSTLHRGNPELVLRLDRDKMSALGIDSAVVARILQSKVQGDTPTAFAERERKIDMRVAMDRETLDRTTRLLDINVNPLGSPVIPLASVAEVRRLEGPSEIRRIGNIRGAEVHADVQGIDLGTTQGVVEATIAGVSRPTGMDVRVGGQKAEMKRSMDSVLLALGLAVFLVYIIMASQFESLVQPFVIMVSLPLAFVGVIFVLAQLDVPISVIALLGCIVLAGIVVNNAIIMLDQINRLRSGGMPKHEAIVVGARTRLRPVLMTTLTTVLGLLPLTGWLSVIPFIGGAAEGLELRAPLAITVVSGLTAATVLTLLVIPVVYSFSDRKA